MPGEAHWYIEFALACPRRLLREFGIINRGNTATEIDRASGLSSWDRDFAGLQNTAIVAVSGGRAIGQLDRRCRTGVFENIARAHTIAGPRVACSWRRFNVKHRALRARALLIRSGLLICGIARRSCALAGWALSSGAFWLEVGTRHALAANRHAAMRAAAARVGRCARPVVRDQRRIWGRDSRSLGRPRL